MGVHHFVNKYLHYYHSYVNHCRISQMAKIYTRRILKDLSARGTIKMLIQNYFHKDVTAYLIITLLFIHAYNTKY